MRFYGPKTTALTKTVECGRSMDNCSIRERSKTKTSKPRGTDSVKISEPERRRGGYYDYSLLNTESGSMLTRMFAQENAMRLSDKDGQGAYLIDWSAILYYPRHGKLIFDCHLNLQGIQKEAKN